MLAILVLIGLAGSLEGSTVDSSPYALGYRGHRVQRSPQGTSRFITGNSQIDSAAVGAAFGALASYGQTQVFGSPCNGRTRNKSNQQPNNRIFGGNFDFGAAVAGAAAAYGGSKLVESFLCG